LFSFDSLKAQCFPISFGLKPYFYRFPVQIDFAHIVNLLVKSERFDG